MPTDNQKPSAENSTALYRAVWHGDFFAGLAVAPFAVSLAITGALCL